MRDNAGIVPCGHFMLQADNIRPCIYYHIGIMLYYFVISSSLCATTPTSSSVRLVVQGIFTTLSK